jgi:hypothetical protein
MTIPGRMDSWSLDEISLVDAGAQKGAHVVIEKRAGADDPDLDPVIKRPFTAERRRHLAAAGAAMPGTGAFPIEDRDDLKNAVQGIGRARDQAGAKQHIIRRARALSATDELPDSWTADDEDDNPTDKAIKAMMAKGAEIRKAAGEVAEPPAARPASAGVVDWNAERSRALAETDRLAKAAVRADPSLSYAKAYSEALMATPAAQRAAQRAR